MTENHVNFIQEIINADNITGRYGKKVRTRFPPEPNGYLHIGHAKAICLNFGMAARNNGLCNLRFDDTNPGKEDIEYVESIKEDVRWLGFDWNDRCFYASDYFDRLYGYALNLIKAGKAYVCDLSSEEIRQYRGTLTQPGRESPYRKRCVEENLDLFMRMKDGEFEDGSRVLRAKIDMSSPNLNMRDPVMYRISRTAHHRTGDKWCIYPMYDYAHPLSDHFEGITHSICTLEFEDHRPLYEWFLNAGGVSAPPRQIEFARLNMTYTVMSKRKLLELVKGGYVSGWDDPRMPTISGLRRRGCTPLSIRNFAEMIGVSKSNSIVDISFLEHCIREDLNLHANRVMVVLKPLKVTIVNYPEDKAEEFDAENNPEDASAGSRKIPFSRVIYIEREDFCEDPPKGFHRLAPGKEIRLKYAYYITCQGVVKDEHTGEVREVICTYDPLSRGGVTADGRKVRGTSHWVSAEHAVDVDVRLFDNLFTVPNPAETPEGIDFKDYINSSSLQTLSRCKAEPDLAGALPGSRFQFLRVGYFYADHIDSSENRPVFNRIVPLKDTWAKLAQREQNNKQNNTIGDK